MDTTHRQVAINEAERLICGDRNASYGSPTQNFEDIAAVWTVQLRPLLKDGAKLTAGDVAALNIGQKLCRRNGSAKADTWIDTVGYGACGYEADVETGQFEPISAPAATPDPEPAKVGCLSGDIRNCSVQGYGHCHLCPDGGSFLENIAEARRAA